MKKKDIKFYNLGDESDYEVFNYGNKTIINNIADSKKEEEIYDKTVKIGLKSIINKDIESLDSKVKSINKRIMKELKINDFVSMEKLDNEIEKIDDIINSVEIIISNVIIEKDKIKVGIFSTNKKIKREKIASLSILKDSLIKSQTELIAIKDEYNKLIKRKKKVKEESYINKVNIEDPLERTVNFYMKKEN